LLWQLDGALYLLSCHASDQKCEDFLNCVNVVDFSREVTSSSCKTVLRLTRAKAMQQFLSTTEHSRLHSCWWMRIIFFRS